MSLGEYIGFKEDLQLVDHLSLIGKSRIMSGFDLIYRGNRNETL